MLERYFVKPSTIDRIHDSWFAGSIERYVEWLASQNFSARTITRRVALLCRFAEFASDRGAHSVTAAEPLIEDFVATRLRTYSQRRPGTAGATFAKDTRIPMQQAVNLALHGTVLHQRACKPFPLLAAAPGFLAYLSEERGLKTATIHHYQHYLNRFATYLHHQGVDSLSALSPALLATFVINAAPQLSASGRRDLCGCLRVFLRYGYRESHIDRDLSAAVEMPQSYRLSTIPRAISWDEVRRMLQVIDRRTPRGCRDYAMLLLLITYGLRGHEVATLTLEDLDWKRERLQVPQRKAGHWSVYPLAGVVGDAIIEYLKRFRPQIPERQVFCRVVAPAQPITAAAVSASVALYLHKAGINVHRAGSHTLRHTCVQRLVDAELPLKTVGDYVGHRSPDSTAIYAKVALSSLRDVALGDGEAL